MGLPKKLREEKRGEQKELLITREKVSGDFHILDKSFIVLQNMISQAEAEMIMIRRPSGVFALVILVLPLLVSMAVFSQTGGEVKSGETQ